MDHKTFDLTLKAEAGADFTGYFATFSRSPDAVGDIIKPGAFVDLDEFVKSGFIQFNHELGAVPIGYPVTATQDGRGLRVAGNFHSTPEAQKVRAMVRERMGAGKAVPCSIGYRVLDQAADYVDGKRVNVLKKLRLFECSIVNIPANPEAGLIAAKAVAVADPARPQGKPREFWDWLARVAGRGPYEAGDVDNMFSLWQSNNSPRENPYTAGRGQSWRSDVAGGVEGGNGMLPPGKSAIDRLREARDRAAAALGRPGVAGYSGAVARHGCDPFDNANWRRAALQAVRDQIREERERPRREEAERRRRAEADQFRHWNPMLTSKDYEWWRELNGGDARFVP